MGQTVLAAMLGVSAGNFNDDWLERALAPHLESIWTEIVTVALRKAKVDLSVILYDLTAFIAHGQYAQSKLVNFGFAHNTPATNANLNWGWIRWLDRNRQSRQKMLVIGDRAMLNAEIAVTYKQTGLRYLAGPRGRRDLLSVWNSLYRN